MSHIRAAVHGYYLVNVLKRDIRRVQEYLGHRSIEHTVRYTQLDDTKFDGFWDD